MRLKCSLFVFVVTFLLPSALLADRKIAAACGMTETAQVSVSFNWAEGDISNVKGKFDKKVNEIENLAKASGVESVTVQSLNYNISSQNYAGSNNPSFQFSGNVSFAIVPTNGAEQFLVDLTKKGYQASLNVSSYKGGSGTCG